MTNNHSLLPAKTAMQLCEDEHQSAQDVHEINEDSYRSDYRLQESKPVDAEYTSFGSEEQPLPAVNKPGLTKRLSYAERRLQRHL